MFHILMAEYIYLGSVSCITALVFLKNSKYKHRTDENENDSDSEKTEKDEADKERLRSLQNVYLRKVKVLKAPKFDLMKLMEVHGDYSEVEAAVARADSDMEEDEGEEA